MFYNLKKACAHLMLNAIFILVCGKTLSGVVSVCNISDNLLESKRFKKRANQRKIITNFARVSLTSR